MDTQALIAAAAAYTERFINAAVPVAKQAYEIGLLTIRIDAVATILPLLVVLVALSVVMWKLVRHRRVCLVKATEYNSNIKEDYDRRRYGRTWDDFSGFSPEGYVLTWLLIVSVAAVPVILLLNVWLWVQLFAPDLWLAHEAILKVMAVAGGK